VKKVLITGAKGRIGEILSKGLSDYELTLVDLPEIDVTDYQRLEELARDQDVVIHLAWNDERENFQTNTSDPDNLLMAENIYRVSLNLGVSRVIMASSVHADDFRSFHGKGFLSPNVVPKPPMPYGRSKVKIEEMGRKYSRQGLEVVCVRLGAVGSKNPPKDREGKILWLSQGDVVSLMKTIIDEEKIPSNFVIMYGVSENKGRIHDYKNPFGWKPKDDSSKS